MKNVERSFFKSSLDRTGVGLLVMLFVRARRFAAGGLFGFLLRRRWLEVGMFGFLVRLTSARRGVDLVRHRCFGLVTRLLRGRELAPLGSEMLHHLLRGQLLELGLVANALLGAEHQVATGCSCSSALAFLLRRSGSLPCFLLRRFRLARGTSLRHRGDVKQINETNKQERKRSSSSRGRETLIDSFARTDRPSFE